jgi:hypothetical protein
MDSKSHREHYKQLHSVRKSWCRQHRERVQDQRGVTIELDGADFEDIPGFYLALGRAVNGESGYFGACLDSLSDCLCGGFGLATPFRLIIRDAARAKRAFSPKNVLMWEIKTLKRQSQLDEDETLRRLAELRTQTVSQRDYLGDLLKILEEAGVKVEFSD